MTERRTVKAAASVSARPHRQMIALLRHVTGHRLACNLEASAGEEVVLQRTGENPRAFDRSLIRAAIAGGLLSLRDGHLAATAQTSAFLRRVLVDPGEAFQEQHREMRSGTVEVEGARQPVRINDNESPLSALARLKDKAGNPFLPPAAIEAGERLSADFNRGQLQPRLTMAYEARLSSKPKGIAGASAEISDTALSARLRVDRAVEAMGPELAGVALDICCFMKGLELVERERQWPVRSAKLMLRTALLALARHYAPPSTPVRRSHAWGEEGFRPSLQRR